MTNHINEKNRSWLLPPLIKTKQPAGLYLVATPIGNLRDITIRALDTLAAADVVLCEDTRVSGKLLAAYGLSKTLQTYNDHTDAGRREAILDAIDNDNCSVALISDAGAPLISDPGYKLVRSCVERGVLVTAIPGASATITGLQLSSFPSDTFTFIGFLPAKVKARSDMIRQWADVPSTLIAFDTAPRLTKTLQDLMEIMPDRKIAVARELTKLYEQVRIDNPGALKDIYDRDGTPKGEIVLIIEPPQQKLMTEDDVRCALEAALATLPTKEAAKRVAQQCGWSKKDVYNLALVMKERGRGA